MNLRVRMKNPVFWIQIVLGAVATALAYAGLTAADLTSWPALWEVLKSTFTNPYCLFLVASNIWAALNDPRPAASPTANVQKPTTSPWKNKTVREEAAASCFVQAVLCRRGSAP